MFTTDNSAPSGLYEGRGVIHVHRVMAGVGDIEL
jgi:hypothetical protein